VFPNKSPHSVPSPPVDWQVVCCDRQVISGPFWVGLTPKHRYHSWDEWRDPYKDSEVRIYHHYLELASGFSFPNWLNRHTQYPELLNTYLKHLTCRLRFASDNGGEVFEACHNSKPFPIFVAAIAAPENPQVVAIDNYSK
jgi:hypothetical protein